MSRLILTALIFASLVCASHQSCREGYEPENALEVVVILDEGARRQWVSVAGSKNKAEEELLSTFREVDEIFKSLCKNNVELEIRVKYIDTPDENILTGVSHGQVDADQTMDNIREWLDNQGISFDQVVYIIDEEITYGNSQQPYVISGYTMISGVCKSYGVTIVTAGYCYQTAMTLASLLAQSMEVDYDGQGGGQGCSSDDGYVMSSYSSRDSPNRWDFSRCSASQIEAFITNRQRSCLQSTSAPSLSNAARLGELVGGNETCKRLTGQYLLDESFYDDYENEICNELKCLDRIEGSRYYMVIGQTPEGMRCMSGRRCFKGVCQREEQYYYDWY